MMLFSCCIPAWPSLGIWLSQACSTVNGPRMHHHIDKLLIAVVHALQASSIAAGSKLTPQQQLAQQLQLPITQPVHLPPGAPSPRQLMQRIKVSSRIAC